MRSEFTKPVMSISVFDSADIVTTSGFQGTKVDNVNDIDNSKYATKSASYDYAKNILSFNN